MSRIIKSLIQSTQNKKDLELIIFLDKNIAYPDLFKFKSKLFIFEKHLSDINNKFMVVDPNLVNSSLSFLIPTISTVIGLSSVISLVSLS